MYYFVKFTYKNEAMEADPDVTLLPCEWVLKADSKEEAMQRGRHTAIVYVLRKDD